MPANSVLMKRLFWRIRRFLNALKTEKYSRVLVAQATYLSLFPNDCIVVPTLGEAEDLIEMERIERDLGF